MTGRHVLLGAAVAATLGVAAVLHFCPCRANDAREPATVAKPPVAPATTTALPVPAAPLTAAGAPGPTGPSLSDTTVGPPRPTLTIDQAPEDPPPPGVDVTYDPSPNPPPLPPAGSESAIYDPWKTPEEKAAFEAREKQAWEERKARELELVVELLTRELELSAMQTQGLHAILQAESERRVTIVDDLTAKRISLNEFQLRVDASLKQGRADMAALFTPEQYAKYQTLEPRRQALNEKTITGH